MGRVLGVGSIHLGFLSHMCLSSANSDSWHFRNNAGIVTYREAGMRDERSTCNSTQMRTWVLPCLKKWADRRGDVYRECCEYGDTYCMLIRSKHLQGKKVATMEK